VGEEGSDVPIYEYLCQSCQHQFEVKQKFSDEPILSCVRCGQSVKKIISAPAIMFKGSGWYVTDYSDKMKAPGQAPAGEPAKSTDGKSDGTVGTAPSKTDTATPASSTATPSSSSSDAGSKSASTTTPSATPTPSPSS
jgi:putative FmdB family regulatory protein